MREGLSRLDEIVDRAKDSISRIEDEEVFKVISAAAPAEHSLTVLEPVIPSNITVACRLLWEHEVKVANIAYHPRWTNIINEWLREEKDATWPLGQKASEIRCLSSTMCPERTVYILAAAAKVGRIVINIPVTVMNADTPKALRYGRVVWEDLGIAVVNDHCVAKITSVPKNAGLPEPRE
jgi:hypothetical protein